MYSYFLCFSATLQVAIHHNFCANLSTVLLFSTKRHWKKATNTHECVTRNSFSIAAQLKAIFKSARGFHSSSVFIFYTNCRNGSCCSCFLSHSFNWIHIFLIMRCLVVRTYRNSSRSCLFRCLFPQCLNSKSPNCRDQARVRGPLLSKTVPRTMLTVQRRNVIEWIHIAGIGTTSGHISTTV